MEIKDEQALTGGGECFLHFHRSEVTLDQLHRMYQLENVKFVTSNCNVNPNDDIIYIDTTGGAVIANLPPANAGQHLVIVKTAGANAVTVLPAIGETVNYAASKAIAAAFVPLRLKAIKGVGYLEI